MIIAQQRLGFDSI